MAVYATVDELKSQSQMVGTQSDAEILLALTAASQAVDGYCRRTEHGFTAADPAYAIEFSGSGKLHQWIPEAASIDLVEIKEHYTETSYTSLSASDWLAFSGNPERPNFNRTPYRGLLLSSSAPIDVWTSTQQRGPWIGLAREAEKTGLPTVRVTAAWGYATTAPDVIKQATLVLASRWLKRGQSSWADAIAQGNNQLMFRKVVDPDIQMMLERGLMVVPSMP